MKNCNKEMGEKILCPWKTEETVPYTLPEGIKPSFLAVSPSCEILSYPARVNFKYLSAPIPTEESLRQAFKSPRLRGGLHPESPKNGETAVLANLSDITLCIICQRR